MFSFHQPVQTVQQQETQSRQHNYAMQANHLIGQEVRINRGGHDSVEGALIAIPGDYLVIRSDNVVVYVNGAHVKSITEGSTGGGKSGGNSGGNRSGARSGGSRHRSFISAPNFQSLLTHLKHRHIQINRGGHEKLDGFLAEISRDNVLLIVDRELVRIPTFHIKNVSTSQKNQNNNNNKNNNNKNENKNENKNNNKSGNNKSGNVNNKSGGNNSTKKSGSNRSGGNKSGGNKSGNRNRSNSGRQGESRNKGNGRG
ncbi:hypothetical protein [Cohnella sp. WQ 127256]|uniref:hypothetical protein n=1 Tax=Cohnella sp. WQ 127256 TaxID=2938790 RepID=UPI002118C22F|nr:hypothetical protein [Cohnella sp. WQ 127256]